jgi:hypothetical protein
MVGTPATHRGKTIKALPGLSEMRSAESSTGSAKGAELASGLGAVVLGAGLALVLPAWLRAYAVPLLVTGIVVHGAGMTLKYRLEGRAGPPLWWERALFWICWLCLAALGLWLAIAFPTA